MRRKGDEVNSKKQGGDKFINETKGGGDKNADGEGTEQNKRNRAEIAQALPQLVTVCQLVTH
jgi:hypothetical protein